MKVEIVPAEVLRLRVLNSYGVPLVGATIADNSGAVQARWVTNADGRAAIPVRRGESRTFFVLPREVSIGVSTIAIPSDDEELAEQQVIVPRVR